MNRVLCGGEANGIFADFVPRSCGAVVPQAGAGAFRLSMSDTDACQSDTAVNEARVLVDWAAATPNVAQRRSIVILIARSV